MMTSSISGGNRPDPPRVADDRGVLDAVSVRGHPQIDATHAGAIQIHHRVVVGIRTRLLLLFLLLLLAALLLGGNGEGVVWDAAANEIGYIGTLIPPPSVHYDCDPCLERSNLRIRAIIHGRDNDDFWQQMVAAMRQVAHDMSVSFDLRGLTPTQDEAQMVRDIRETARDTSIDAVIVSIPSPVVKDAVEEAIQAGRAVFGVNSGGDLDIPGLLGHVAMDNFEAGVGAGKKLIELWMSEAEPTPKQDAVDSANTPSSPEAAPDQQRKRNVLFINHAKGNGGMQQRFEGLQSSLHKTDLLTVNVSEQVVVLGDENLQPTLHDVLDGCPYDAVVMGGATYLEEVTRSYYRHGCSFQKHLLGTFDTNSLVYDSIALSKLAFSISQQQYLQANLAVTMATLFAATGKSLKPLSGEVTSGIYQTGPRVVTRATLPSDKQQICESEAFPVCNDDGAVFTSLWGNRCACTDRSNIRIGAALPNPYDEPFWLPVWEGAQQAANDVGVQLIWDIVSRPEDLSTENTKTAERIKALCQAGFDGVVTTIKSGEVENAIEFCHSLEVPVITVNSGEARAKSLGLPQHIGMDEYKAGRRAGQVMIDAGVKHVYCMNFQMESDLSSSCEGLRDAIRSFAAQNGGGNESTATYEGVLVYTDNVLVLKQEMEANITYGGDDWEGVGLFLVSDFFLESVLELKASHTKLILGTIDAGPIVYDSIEKGLLLFSIDQQPFLQGYFPTTLLTWIAHTRQTLISHFLETGPRLVEETPSAAETQCIENMFEVCQPPSQKNQLGGVRFVGLIMAGIIVAVAIGFMVWVMWNRRVPVVQSSQPVFLVAICVGAIIIAATIIPLSLDDGVLAEDGGCVGCDCAPCDVACMAAPWLFTVGFTIVFASLFSKIWRLNRLMDGAVRFRRVQVTTRDVLVPFAALLFLNLGFMLVWTIVDPMHWDRSRRCGSDDKTSYGYCMIGSGNTSIGMAVSVLLVNFSAVVLACVEAYRARNLSTEFSESRYIALVMICILQVMLIGVPLTFLVHDSPPAQFFVLSGIITVVCLSVLVLIFVPKIWLLQEESEKEGGGDPIQESESGRASLSSLRQSTRSIILTSSNGSRRRSSLNSVSGLRLRNVPSSGYPVPPQRNSISSSSEFPSSQFELMAIQEQRKTHRNRQNVVVHDDLKDDDREDDGGDVDVLRSSSSSLQSSLSASDSCSPHTPEAEAAAADPPPY